MNTAIDTSLLEYVPGRIWTKKYPIHYAGCDFFARTTLVRLRSGDVLVHSPCPIDATLVQQLEPIGRVAHIVAPGNYHYFHVADWQRAFPEAAVWICPGVERKRADLEFDWFLADRPPPVWEEELDQVLVRGNRIVWEVAFLDKPSKTLVLTDLVENMGDGTEGTNWVLRFWWKAVMNMWNRPKPAPEYQMGWKDKAAARRSLERILAWDFERVIIAHGENLERDAKEAVRAAWARPLAFG
jgi:glyoxylase-like metal-dependent hydrolase (beta-lactamase superfamily II)